MKLFSVLAILVLPIAGLTTPVQVTLSCSGNNNVVRPAWEKENRQLIVPLTSQARTGLVEPDVEEGLIAALGTRFTNALFEKDVSDGSGFSQTASIKCVKKCGGVILKSLPCLYTAIKDKNVKEVLTCVSKEKLCACASCLPEVIDQFVEQHVCASEVIDLLAEGDRFSPYVDFMAVADNSVAIQAFRGELYNYQVEQLKAINGQTGSVSRNGDVEAACFGTECGSCCCIGVCAPFVDKCVGVCT